MPDPCPFCSIAAHRADAEIVYEDTDVVAFMDARPIRPGHVLVIPRVHEPSIFDVAFPVYSRVFETARTYARAIQRAFFPKRVGIVVAGFDVAHAHVHVIPMAEHHDVTSRAILDGTLVAATPAELRATAAQITHALNAEP